MHRKFHIRIKHPVDRLEGNTGNTKNEALPYVTNSEAHIGGGNFFTCYWYADKQTIASSSQQLVQPVYYPPANGKIGLQGSRLLGHNFDSNDRF